MKFLYFLFALTTSLVKADWDGFEAMQIVVSPKENYTIGRSQIGRIVGGEEVARNSVPYQVALFIFAEDGKYFCGGALISENYVLTAAHCIIGDVIEVILGAHNIREMESTQQRLNSSKFVVHQDYDSSKAINDIALVALPKSVELNGAVGLVKLPSYSDLGKNFSGDISQASGWGQTSDEATAISNVLYAVTAPILSNLVCGMELLGAIKDTHICMDGIEKKSACSGDSGGPLVSENILIGIISFGSAFGCEATFPTAATRITSYMDWICNNSDVTIEN